MTGCGLIIGPIVGTHLFDAFGLQNCFLIIGAVIILMSGVFFIFYDSGKLGAGEARTEPLLEDKFSDKMSSGKLSVGSGFVQGGLGVGSQLALQRQMGAQDDESEF